MHPHVLDLRTAAARTSMQPAVLRRRAHRGEIPGSQVGRQWRFWHPSLVLHLVGPEAAAMLDSSPQQHCDPGIVTTRELADLLGIPERTIALLLRHGALPGRKDHTRWRIYWPVIRDRIAAGQPLGGGLVHPGGHLLAPSLVSP